MKFIRVLKAEYGDEHDWLVTTDNFFKMIDSDSYLKRIGITSGTIESIDDINHHFAEFDLKLLIHYPNVKAYGEGASYSEYYTVQIYPEIQVTEAKGINESRGRSYQIDTNVFNNRNIGECRRITAAKTLSLYAKKAFLGDAVRVLITFYWDAD